MLPVTAAGTRKYDGYHYGNPPIESHIASNPDKYDILHRPNGKSG
jgi:hypothetical protein